ncbi:hypothetical protein AB0G81_07470, partial [Streptomyces asoensis]
MAPEGFAAEGSSVVDRSASPGFPAEAGPAGFAPEGRACEGSSAADSASAGPAERSASVGSSSEGLASAGDGVRDRVAARVDHPVQVEQRRVVRLAQGLPT